MSFEFPQTIGQNDRRDSFQEFLAGWDPRTIMSRIIGNDQGWPNISTEAFSGHPDRRLGLAFFLRMTPQQYIFTCI